MTRAWKVVEAATATDGTPIDAATAAQLAADFETDDHALDGARRVRARSGRPTLSGAPGPTPKVAARIPDALRQAVEAKAARENITLAEAVRQALSSWVDAA